MCDIHTCEALLSSLSHKNSIFELGVQILSERVKTKFCFIQLFLKLYKKTVGQF